MTHQTFHSSVPKSPGESAPEAYQAIKSSAWMASFRSDTRSNFYVGGENSSEGESSSEVPNGEQLAQLETIQIKSTRLDSINRTGKPTHILTKHDQFLKYQSSPFLVYYYDKTAPNNLLLLNDVPNSSCFSMVCARHPRSDTDELVVKATKYISQVDLPSSLLTEFADDASTSEGSVVSSGASSIVPVAPVSPFSACCAAHRSSAISSSRSSVSTSFQGGTILAPSVPESVSAISFPHQDHLASLSDGASVARAGCCYGAAPSPRSLDLSLVLSGSVPYVSSRTSIAGSQDVGCCGVRRRHRAVETALTSPRSVASFPAISSQQHFAPSVETSTATFTGGAWCTAPCGPRVKFASPVHAAFEETQSSRTAYSTGPRNAWCACAGKPDARLATTSSDGVFVPSSRSSALSTSSPSISSSSVPPAARNARCGGFLCAPGAPSVLTSQSEASSLRSSASSSSARSPVAPGVYDCCAQALESTEQEYGTAELVLDVRSSDRRTEATRWYDRLFGGLCCGTGRGSGTSRVSGTSSVSASSVPSGRGGCCRVQSTRSVSTRSSWTSSVGVLPLQARVESGYKTVKPTFVSYPQVASSYPQVASSYPQAVVSSYPQAVVSSSAKGDAMKLKPGRPLTYSVSYLEYPSLRYHEVFASDEELRRRRRQAPY